MKIRRATFEDIEIISQHDHHIAKKELENIISLNRVYVVEEAEQFIGWMRYGLFWDNTPFCNMLYFLEEYRQKGYGRQLMECWEKEMKELGYPCIMTSTASDEEAQYFYAKLGYEVTGAFRPEGDPTELILAKNI